ncbi:hypothetical protein PQR11_24425 [Paraburkholderia strydomiana]|uniref:hypothetical protein n=1 Tax=Paraburkholderia strydomiana TaxID=1245417 RepID=UPI0038BDE7AA
MSSPTFFIYPPKSGGSTVISFFDLNKGKDQFTVFEWTGDGWTGAVPSYFKRSLAAVINRTVFIEFSRRRSPIAPFYAIRSPGKYRITGMH